MRKYKLKAKTLNKLKTKFNNITIVGVPILNEEICRLITISKTNSMKDSVQFAIDYTLNNLK